MPRVQKERQITQWPEITSLALTWRWKEERRTCATITRLSGRPRAQHRDDSKGYDKKETI